jgi:hypothetical protein
MTKTKIKLWEEIPQIPPTKSNQIKLMLASIAIEQVVADREEFFSNANDNPGNDRSTTIRNEILFKDCFWAESDEGQDYQRLTDEIISIQHELEIIASQYNEQRGETFTYQ